MSAYINIITNEYPRHPGDLELDPNGQYALVEWVEPPEIDPATQRRYEVAPINDNGTWRMAWAVHQLTQKEIDEANKPFDPFHGNS